MNRRDLHRAISRTGRGEVNTTFTPNARPDAMVINNYYRELLREKVLGEEPELMELVLRHIQELRPRFMATVELMSRGEEIAQIAVYGVLIEEGQEIVDYWYENDVDPSGFQMQVLDFYSKLQGRGILKADAITRPTKHAKVDGVSITFTFA